MPAVILSINERLGNEDSTDPDPKADDPGHDGVVCVGISCEQFAFESTTFSNIFFFTCKQTQQDWFEGLHIMIKFLVETGFSRDLNNKHLNNKPLPATLLYVMEGSDFA